MEYQATDACPNDHIIYNGKYASELNCPQCQINRYRIDQLTKKVPHKVLRYIPIIPRLQRLFRCRNITQFMDYHAWNRSEDDVLRMPVDVYLYKNIEERWPIFKEEPLNVRISLVADGVNPFGELRSIY
jgi:plasmid rolling circle replication initiator protein Rep